MNNNLRITILIGTSLLAWVVIIITSGAGWNPFKIEWNFTNTGSFGDSFGPLSALMAAIAAISAIQALKYQQAEITRSKIKEAEEDRRTRKNDFERTFFLLFQSLKNISNSIDIEGSTSQKTGQDAFKSIALSYRRTAATFPPSQAWERVFERYINDLGHYFRFLYQMINFIHSQDDIDRYFYVRIIRSSLSDSELLLLAINCAYGEGREKFKIFIEEYALLHNLSDFNRQNHSLNDLFSPSAFQRNHRP